MPTAVATMFLTLLLSGVALGSSMPVIANPGFEQIVSGNDAPGQVFGDNKSAALYVYLDSSIEGRAEGIVKAGKTEMFSASATIVPGENVFEWKWSSGAIATR